MLLKEARAARAAGNHGIALAAFDGGLDDADPAATQRERFATLLELTVSRRVVEPLLARLRPAAGVYRGFSHIDPAMLDRTTPAALQAAFDDMAAVDAVDDAALDRLADELSMQARDAAALQAMVDARGLAGRAYARLAVARAWLHEKRPALVAEILTPVVRDTPNLVLGQKYLALALLAVGQVRSAAFHAYFAVQMRRAYSDPREGVPAEAILHYCGHQIFFHDGVFYSLSPDDDRVNVSIRDGQFVQLSNPIPPRIRSLYRGIARRLLPGFVLRLLQRIIFRTVPAPVASKSSDLFELTQSIRREAVGPRDPGP